MEQLVCTKCIKKKDITDFNPISTTTRGYQSQCKVCYRDTKLKSKRTKKGMTGVMYDSQRSNSKTRGHPMPTYSKKELREWLYSQELFHHLYNLWVVSNYDKMLKPSVDRLEDDLPYSFSNIQLTVWQVNQDKNYEQRKCK